MLVAIRLGIDESLPAMERLLASHGTKEIAEDCLNCGWPGLARAAQRWASSHNYRIHHRTRWPGGSVPAHWGRF